MCAVVRSGKDQNTVCVNADQGRDLHPLAEKFYQGKHFEFSAFLFSLQLMLEQSLSNLIVCLMISHKKLHTKVAQTSWHAAVDTK